MVWGFGWLGHKNQTSGVGRSSLKKTCNTLKKMFDWFKHCDHLSWTGLSPELLDHLKVHCVNVKRFSITHEMLTEELNDFLRMVTQSLVHHCILCMETLSPLVDKDHETETRKLFTTWDTRFCVYDLHSIQSYEWGCDLKLWPFLFGCPRLPLQILQSRIITRFPSESLRKSFTRQITAGSDNLGFQKFDLGSTGS